MSDHLLDPNRMHTRDVTIFRNNLLFLIIFLNDLLYVKYLKMFWMSSQFHSANSSVHDCIIVCSTDQKTNTV